MQLFVTILVLVVGVLVLGYGADVFVASASKLARRFGISPMVIGLTVVAFGTSAPEMAVNILAAMNGNSAIAFGNVVGSNTFNVLVILGICALIKPLVIQGQILKIDIPLMMVASVLLWWMGQDGALSRFEAAIFAVGIIGYTALQVKLAMKERASVKAEFSQEFNEGGPAPRNILLLLGGLVLLIIGARMFVYGAVELARLWGISESVIALTIVSAGTSLPEVATSVAATLKGEKEIAIGNVVGSNIFNILAVLGISGMLSPTPLLADLSMQQMDLPVMVLSMLLLVVLAKTPGRFQKFLGGFFLVGYGAYVVELIGR